MKKKYEIVDLSVGFYKNMPKYDAAWFPNYSFEEIAPEKLIDQNWKRRFTEVDLFAHNGTHVEVSDHVYRDGNVIGNYSIDKFLGYPIIIDLSDLNYGEGITYNNLFNKIKDRKIKEGSIILLSTQYNDKHWGEKGFWDNSPWLEEDAAQLISDLKPSFVGIDFQTEKPKEKNYVVHKKLLKNNIILCEYLFNLNQIDENCLFIALPIDLKELEAAPVRAAAIRFI